MKLENELFYILIVSNTSASLFPLKALSTAGIEELERTFSETKVSIMSPILADSKNAYFAFGLL